MDTNEAEKFKDLIQGAYEVNGKALTVLYDSGTSHSFISHRYVSVLQLPVSELSYYILVSTPRNKLTKTSQVCMSVPLRIESRTFIANLICLPLSGLNVILGMD